jgi:hypothetical protein
MGTSISEIADGIYRLSIFVPDIAPPAGFTFNQFLVLGRRAAPVPHRPAQDVPARVGSGVPDHAG